MAFFRTAVLLLWGFLESLRRDLVASVEDVTSWPPTQRLLGQMDVAMAMAERVASALARSPHPLLEPPPGRRTSVVYVIPYYLVVWVFVGVMTLTLMLSGLVLTLPLWILHNVFWQNLLGCHPLENFIMPTPRRMVDWLRAVRSYLQLAAERGASRMHDTPWVRLNAGILRSFVRGAILGLSAFGTVLGLEGQSRAVQWEAVEESSVQETVEGRIEHEKVDEVESASPPENSLSCTDTAETQCETETEMYEDTSHLETCSQISSNHSDNSNELHIIDKSKQSGGVMMLQDACQLSLSAEEHSHEKSPTSFFKPCHSSLDDKFLHSEQDITSRQECPSTTSLPTTEENVTVSSVEGHSTSTEEVVFPQAKPCLPQSYTRYGILGTSKSDLSSGKRSLPLKREAHSPILGAKSPKIRPSPCQRMAGSDSTGTSSSKQQSSSQKCETAGRSSVTDPGKFKSIKKCVSYKYRMKLGSPKVRKEKKLGSSKIEMRVSRSPRSMPSDMSLEVLGHESFSESSSIPSMHTSPSVSPVSPSRPSPPLPKGATPSRMPPSPNLLIDLALKGSPSFTYESQPGNLQVVYSPLHKTPLAKPIALRPGETKKPVETASTDQTKDDESPTGKVLMDEQEIIPGDKKNTRKVKSEKDETKFPNKGGSSRPSGPESGNAGDSSAVLQLGSQDCTGISQELIDFAISLATQLAIDVSPIIGPCKNGEDDDSRSEESLED